METGENVTTALPHRKTHSLARTAAQIEKARELRHMPTDAERAAWFLLLGAKFKGFKFRRRHALGPYFVDFYCPQRRLMVELDGSVHAQPAQARRDLCRDAHLKEMGFTILRFSNGIVLNAPEIFVQIVWDAVWSLPEAFG